MKLPGQRQRVTLRLIKPLSKAAAGEETKDHYILKLPDQENSGIVKQSLALGTASVPVLYLQPSQRVLTPDRRTPEGPSFHRGQPEDLQTTSAPGKGSRALPPTQEHDKPTTLPRGALCNLPPSLSIQEGPTGPRRPAQEDQRQGLHTSGNADTQPQ